MEKKIESLCRNYTDLDSDEIREIADAAKRLGNMSSILEADAFIDCALCDGSGDAIVIAESKPVEKPSSYTISVVGMVASKEKEPAVNRTLSLGVPTKFMKAKTQENANVVQTVDPIFYKDRVIGVYIIEQRMEQVILSANIEDSKEMGDETVDMDLDPVGNEYDSKVADTIEEGILFVDNDNKVIFCNKATSRAYKRLGFLNEVIGCSYEDICLVKETEEEKHESLFFREVRLGNYYFKIKRLNVYRPDIKFIVTISDITAKKTQEQALVLKSAAFKEMHHRIKNNLQTIASLLRLQKNKIESPEGKAALQDTISRILAISATHEIILGQEMDVVNLNDIINRIKDNTSSYYTRDDFDLEIECHGGDFQVSMIQATAIALILNELMQNSIKYAFTDKKSGKILILADNTYGDEIKLVFKDNGCGFDVDSKIKSGSMGWAIIKLMVKERLKGHITVTSGSKGTKVVVVF